MTETKNWNPVVGSLLSTLQVHDLTLMAVDDILLDGTPRQRRQTAKAHIVSAATSWVHVEYAGTAEKLLVVLENLPEAIILEHSAGIPLRLAVEEFEDKWEGINCPTK